MDLLLIIKRNGSIVLFTLALIFCLYASFLYLTVGQQGHDTVLVVLSEQFIKWKIALPTTNLPPRDIANYYSNFYVYFGPLGSLILIPFVLIFGESFPQVSLGVGAMIATFAAVYLISKNFKFKKLDSLWLSLFFTFSTVLFSSSVINITAYQVEALGVPFILFALWAYFSKKNAFFIGLFIALAVLTRYTLFLSTAFFFFEMLRKRISFKSFILILIPVILAIGLLGMYNNRRFHSYFETGYRYATSGADLPIGFNLKYGSTSVTHIPANLYSFLIMAPEPLLTDGEGGMVLKFPYLKVSPWGLAIWFTSPLFLLLIFRFKVGKYTVSSALTALLLSIPVFLWYSVGFAQFGYRYSLDFLPFLFILLIPCLGTKLSKTAISLILLGVLFNCIYLDSIWEIYPVFFILH